MDERQARIESIVSIMRELESQGSGTAVTKRAIMIVRRDFDKYSHLLDNDIISTVISELSGIVIENTPEE